MNTQETSAATTAATNYVRSLGELVKAHPSVMYAQAVLRPSLALAQGHSLSLIQGLKVTVNEFRLGTEMQNFNHAMLMMIDAVVLQAEKNGFVTSIEKGLTNTKGKSNVETLRLCVRDDERVLMVVLYSSGLMIQHCLGYTDCEKIVKDFCTTYEPIEKGYIHYIIVGDQGLQEVRQENNDSGIIVDQAYPMLDGVGGATVFIDSYLADESSVLNLYGLAGSGKSTLMRKVAARSQGRHVILVDNPLVYRDPKLASELIGKVRMMASEGKRPMLLLEEVDKYIQEKSEGNDFLIQLLSMSSGVLKTDVKIVLASNLTNSDKVLDALQRSGRSYGNVEFHKLTAEQAVNCRNAMGLPPIDFTEPVSLADVLCTRVVNVGTNKNRVGFTA